jgi:hypothetical protein
MTIENIKNDLAKEGGKKNIEILQRFFKTKKGEYGAGDVFIGVKVQNKEL